MKRRIFAMILAGAMVLALAACGGNNGGGSSSSNSGSSSSGSSGVSSSLPDGSTPGGSNPDGSSTGSASGGASSADGSQSGGVTLTLNRTDITLNKAGATFNLRYTAEPDTDGIASFTSSDTKVATVTENGSIKAVAPGKATITVTYDGATATANVTCDWKEETKPDTSTPGGSSGSSSGGASSGGSGSEAPAPSSVNLSDFYNAVTGKYQFSFMMEADDTMLSTFFAGLSDLSLSQCLVYQCGMSPSPHGDFVLVQVSDSKDMDTVKSILQARINYMVGDGNGPGGAFYPMEQTTWEEYSRIAVNGDYVMLIAHENCDDIVKEFNALF